MVRSISRRQQVSALALLSVLASSPAFTQDATLDTERTTSLTTSTFNGANAGTLTITSAGTITVANGTALTVDGPHNISIAATNTITSNDLLNGRGLLIDASGQRIVSDLSLAGDINVAGQTLADFDFEIDTNIVGIELSGDFGFEGNLVTENEGSITAFGSGARGIFVNTEVTGDINNQGDITITGNNTVGIDINAAVTGDVINGGTIALNDTGTTGIRVGADIDGAFVQGGRITVGDPQVGAELATPAIAGVLVERSITGGILFDGIGQNNDVDGDGNPDVASDSFLRSTGGAPALQLTATEDGGDVVIGEVGDTGFSFVNKGGIETVAGSREIASVGISFEGASETARVILENGIHFDTGTLGLIAQDETSTGIIIGNFASVPTFLNEGTIDIDTSASSAAVNGTDNPGVGGVSTGILVAEQGSLTSFTNNGNFLVGSLGADQNAYGIRDLSGTLTSVVNTGTFRITSAETIGGETIAIDARSSTSDFSLTNSGSFTGNVYLGSGDDTVALNGGEFNGDLNFGTGANTLTITNNAEFTGSSTFDGTLDLFVDGSDIDLASSSQLNFTNAAFSGESTLTFTVDPEDGTNGQLAITNTLTATSDVNIVPIITRITTQEQSFDLITAQTINLADADASLELTSTPFLFDVTLGQIDTENGSTITLNARPRTAEELGIATQLTTLYDNVITSEVDLDAALESSIAGLQTKENTEAALTSLLPDITNGSINLALASKRQMANHLANRLSDYVQNKDFQDGAWAREVTTVGNQESSLSALNSDLLTVGLTFGYDRPINKNLVVGVNAGFTLNGLTGDDQTIAPELSTFAPFVSAYSLARAGDFYFGGQLTAQYVSIDRERIIDFGTVDRLVTGSNTAWNFIATTEAGYELKLGGLHIRPYGRLSAQSYSEGGYIEEGGSSANLDVGSRSITRFEGTVGASLGYDFKWKTKRDDRIVRPEVFYTYTKKLGGSEVDPLEAIFVGGDTSFLVELDRTATTVKQMGGAFNIFGLDSTARIHYAYEELDDLRAHAVSFNFGLAF